MSAYTQIGGARIGFFNATWPFAKIALTPERLTLRVLWKTYRVENDASLTLRHHRGLFANGLQVESTQPGLPSLLIFWPMEPDALFKNLESMGYSLV